MSPAAQSNGGSSNALTALFKQAQLKQQMSGSHASAHTQAPAPQQHKPQSQQAVPFIQHLQQAAQKAAAATQPNVLQQLQQAAAAHHQQQQQQAAGSVAPLPPSFFQQAQAGPPQPVQHKPAPQQQAAAAGPDHPLNKLFVK